MGFMGACGHKNYPSLLSQNSSVVKLFSRGGNHGANPVPPTSPLFDDATGPNGAAFDTTLPSSRLVQQWIRRQRAVVVVLHQGLRLHGRLLWQDSTALALQLRDGQDPVLVQRRGLALIHPVEVSLETAPRVP